MKKVVLGLIMLISSIVCAQQVPQKFSYQGVVRDDSDNLLSNQLVDFRFTIAGDVFGQQVFYQETQQVSTNQFGLVNLFVGDGVVLSGTFTAIPWGSQQIYFLIDLDIGSGFVPMGSQELVSVPYALYARSGVPGPTGPVGEVGLPGPTGLMGPSGSTGPAGETGPIGPTGLQGIQGNDGEIGPTGPTGIQGIQGVIGLTGQQGLIGPMGPTGEMGPTGAQGITGSTGNNGQDGAIGPTGAIEKPFTIAYGAPYGRGGTSSRTPVFNLYSDEFVLVLRTSGSNCTFFVQLQDRNYQQRDITLDFPGATNIQSAVLIDSVLYILVLAVDSTPNAHAVFKYDAYNIASGGTEVVFSGLTLTNTNSTIMMTSGGTSIYFNYNAGNSANSYDIARYSLNGNLFTYQTTISCGNISNSFERILVNSSGNLFGNPSGINDITVYCFDQSGNLLYQIGGLVNSTNVWNWGDVFYFSQPAVELQYTKLIVE
jgi:hypothetical protein